MAWCVAGMGGVLPARAATLALTEIVADNVGGLADEDGATPDWIEIHNPGLAAVNLAGWSLTDDPGVPGKWRFPALTLAPKGFLVVFASGKDRTNGPVLHASFELEAGGGYVGLAQGDLVVSALVFPAQRAGTSYGVAQSVAVDTLVGTNAPASVLVPANGVLGTGWTTNGFVPAGWMAGTNGVGYETAVPGFQVRNLKVNVVVDSLAKAETALVTPAQQTSVALTNTAVVNFNDAVGEGHYGNNLPFPGQSTGQAVDDFVLEAVGTITIPTAGAWTFGVNSDDGFRLQIVTNLAVNGTNTLQYDPPRGPGDTLGTFVFAAPGDYPLRLLFYERGGGAEVELFAVAGVKAAWDTAFDLVGDTANGGLAVRSQPVAGGSALGYRGFIRTDVQAAMLGVAPGAYVRLPFTATNVAGRESLYLSVRYDDGVVAYLNGTEVARRNAPVTPAWNSAATAAHGGVAPEEINLTPALGLLREGGNVLALHGMNDAAAGLDFLVQGELREVRVTGSAVRYFAAPTPGAYNTGAAFDGFVDEPSFSFDHGFYDAPITLTLSCGTPGATLRCTLDGSGPTLANGFTYGGPLLITNTTTLRVAAFRDGLSPSRVECRTYLFVEDIVRQSPTGAAPGPGWPTVNSPAGQIYDYGMDPDIVNNPAYSADVRLGLKSLPTFSIVGHLPDFFDPSTGIYANPRSDERAWERPCSLEMIFPDGREGFQINCGIRIRGGFSRDPANPKHAFRIFFRQDYGASKLRYPLLAGAPSFGGPPAVEEFNKIDLRTMQNYSWSYQNDSRMMCLRDQSSRDAQLAMGEVSSHGLFAHVYINGHYWGIYNTDERPEANFGESYFGGDAENYDAVKVDPDLGYIVEPTDGTLDAWFRLWQAATNGFTGNDSYFRIQGRNPDGTPNPAYENLLEIDNLIVYMLVINYGGNLDAPISNFLGNDSPNNWFGFRDRTGTNGGFRFVAHDSEHTLLDAASDRSGLVDGQLGVINADWTSGNPAAGSSFGKSSPQYLWFRLVQNAEFRLRVADLVQKHCFNGGALTPESMRATFLLRSNELYRAIACESARWGDAKNATPYNRGHWIAALNTVLNTFVPARTANLVNQLRADGFYPTVAAPALNHYGGIVSNGFQLFLTNSTPGGILYYTRDGSDPRLLGGALNAAALVHAAGSPLPITAQTTLKARVLSNTVWSALVEASYYTLQNLTNLVVSELMYHPPPLGPAPGEDFEFIEFQNAGPVELDLSGLQLTEGVAFTFTNGARLGPGQFLVLARNPGQLATNKYPGLAVHGAYAGRLDNNGERLTLAHPLAGPILSFAYNDGGRWPIAADGQGFSLVPAAAGTFADPGSPLRWRGSTQPGGSPGAADPASPLPAVLITEVLANSTLPAVDAIELHNPTPAPVNLKGWYLTDNSNLPRKYRFDTDTLLAPGEYRVVTEAAFNPVPGTTNNFSLNGAGEEVYLISGQPDGADLTGYSHGFAFDAAPAGRTVGRHLNSLGEEQHVPLSLPTLGGPNAVPWVGDVILRQVMYHPPDQALGLDNQFDEFIVLANRTAAPVPFFDPAAPAHTWRVRGGVSLDFPPGFTLGPGSNVVIVSFPTDSPGQVAAFLARYSAFQDTPLFGPYAGKLDNSSDTVELQAPDVPTTNGVPYYVLDRVSYQSRAPWPTNADGGGAALVRQNPAAYGDDVAHWTSLLPLSITTPPVPWTVRQGQGATNRIVASGTPPLTYRWRLHGTNLAPGNGFSGVDTPTLILTNAQAFMRGPYTVLVSDANGSILSTPAPLTVLVPPIFILQPQSQTLLQGDPLTLTVGLSNISSGPFNYVWRYQSQVIASNGQVASYFNSLTLTNLLLQSSNLNRYRCDVQSPAITGQGQASSNAFITVLADNDRDRLPDFWEAQFGFNTNDTADARLDLDGDRMVNVDEYNAGTDPTDPASVLKMGELLPAGPGGLGLSFVAVSNRTYSVQASATLPGGWTSLTNVPAGPTNRTVSVTVSTGLPAGRYLRIVTPQQP
ncbi:MAG: hypothetical protein RJA22_2835 [Verrucomicrobiota bacterium]